MTNRIYAGNVNKDGSWAKGKIDVTEDAVPAVAEHLLAADIYLEFSIGEKKYHLKVVEITEKLEITSIEPNMWTHDNEGREIITTFALMFRFYDKMGFVVYVTKEALQEGYASFSMVESDESDLHASFSDVIETTGVWQMIKERCEAFDKAYFEEQTRLLA